jgi:serine/threonine protein kinase
VDSIRSAETDPQNNLGLQQQFITQLDKLRPANSFFIIDTKAILMLLSHNGTISSDIPALEQNGLYFSPEFADSLQEANQVPHRVGFEPASLRAIGRENSRNQVFFGDLTLDNFSSSGTFNLPVAIKPFLKLSKQRVALNEFVMSKHLASLGINSFKQIGILKNDNDHYLISIFEPEVITLDSIDWDNLNDQETQFVINRGLETLALLHINGLAHGDAKLKNLAISPQMQKHWIVDMEHGVSFINTAQNIGQPNGLVAKICQDLKQLSKSLLDTKIIDPTQTKEQICEQNLRRVLLPYAEIINRQPGEIRLTKSIQENLNIIINLLVNEYLGDIPNRTNIEPKIFATN